jgi:hypothetical protein
MKVLCACVISATILSADTFAQQLAPRTRLRPITSPVRDAGVYHLSLGSWTRHVDATSASNWDVIYANTCPVGYYLGLFQHEYIADEGRVPGPNGPVLCDPARLSTNVGCACSYVVSAFEIGYCTGLHQPVSVKVGFQSAYVACAVPATEHSFTLTGLPGAALHTQACWEITIDLGASQSFTIAADGANCAWAPNDLATQHLFGWTFENLSSVTGVGTDYVGLMIAGSGGPQAPVPTCSMVDGTRWDTLTCPGFQGGGPAKWPNNLTEDGWGMDTQDRFRDDTSVPGGQLSPPSGPGCFFFGGGPAGSFYMRLFSETGCPPPHAIDLCSPGVSGVIVCPCSNPQVPAGSARGCNNSANTGGAVLWSTGLSSIANDTLQITSAGETPSGSSILLQGQLPANSSGIVFGQGVRCIVNALHRLYLHSAIGGSVTFPQGADPAIGMQSAAKGDVISPPSTRLYAVYYRDPTVLGSCTPAQRFNVSQTQSLVWVP